jgi:hypothetical protein
VSGRIVNRTRVAALVLALAAAPLVGCGGAAVELPRVPEVLETAAGGVYAGAFKALGIAHATGELVDRVSAAEAKWARPGAAGVPLIPAELHRQFQSGFRALAVDALKTIDDIEKGVVTDWPALRARIEPMLVRAEDLVKAAQQVRDAIARRDLLSALTGIASLIREAMPPGAPDPVGPAAGGVQWSQ